MVRVITQETFDAVVKENIEEFGLEKEEAIKEAIAQFESQVLILIQSIFGLLGIFWLDMYIDSGQIFSMIFGFGYCSILVENTVMDCSSVGALTLGHK